MKKPLIPLILLVASGTAMAQAQQIDVAQMLTAANRAGDWSMALWSDVLGNFFRNPFDSVGSPTTTLGWLFMFFNGSVLAVTLIYLVYGILAGIVGTAQDGQAMGQRINSAWYPIRVVTGLTGAMPMFAGFTGSQALLMFIASLGIGTANIMFSSVVQGDQMVKLTGTASISGAPGVAATELSSTIESLTRSNICVQMAQRVGEEYRAAGAAGSDWWLGYSMLALHSADGVLLRFGRPGDPEACGAVGVRLEKYREAQSSTAFRVASVDYQGIRASVSQAASDQLLAANALAARLARDYIRAVDIYKNVAANGGAAQLDVDIKAVDAAVKAYARDINALIDKSVATGGSSIKDAAQAKMMEGGWMAAGSWYSTWAEANAALADAVAGIKFSRSEPSAVTATVDEEIQRFDRLVKSARAAASGLATNGGKDGTAAAVNEIQKTTCGLAGISYDASATGDCSIGQVIVRKLIGGAAYGSGGGQSSRDDVGLVNPVIAFKNAGDYIMAVGSTLVGAQLAAPVLEASPLGRVSSVAGVVSGKAGEGDSQTWTSAMSRAAGGVAAAGWMLLILGGLMSLYLPMLPFISWFSAIVTYCASLFEGLAAMPLHSISHMHTGGEGMGQGTAKGYLFYLNTFARPPLMLITFFFASALSIGLGTFLAKAFLPAIGGVQGNSVTGLASIVGLLIIYVVINITFLQSIFGLIEVIPDQVIGFVGAGELHSPLGKDSEAKINALFAAAQRNGQATGMGAMGAVGGMKDKAEGTGRSRRR